ncbi:7999_t:CDS:2 [Acaulospora morrowiae]|uniref:7999_t:CDS:1 n=1 Tax=Acaulospora morrowiae TaxID=94023 RepID=A0A9N9C4W8_9GLOM|nr:7999_t:CDS:2 [Acaulospora morrowiae]
MCDCCGLSLSTSQKLHQHYASNKNPCHLPVLSPNQLPQFDPEIEYLDALGLFDFSEIGKSSHSEANSSPEAKREYLEALGILPPIPKFHQTDTISSGCELLDDHYQVEIGKESIYSEDPINTLNVLREQIINIFNDRFDLTHGFKTRLCLTGKMGRTTNYQEELFEDRKFAEETDNDEKDYKEVLFKNKAVVVTAKKDIPRIVDELIWDIENRIEVYIHEGSASSHLPLPKGIPKRNNGIINIQNEDDRCFEYCNLAELYPAQYHRERVSWYTPYLGKLDFNGIQFPVRADNDTMEKFEKQNPDISVSIYGWSEKELIPIRIAPKSKVHDRCNHKEGHCRPRKLIRLLLITGDDPNTGKSAQHYCLIQGRDGLGKLVGYTTKHNGKLYVCDYCVSHRTHDLKIDAQHMEDCERINNPAQKTVMPEEADIETLATIIEKSQGSKTTAIQEHKVISFDYIIRRSDGKTKVPVKIRGDDPAGEFIKAMEKETEQCQDFLAGGHVIRNSAKKLISMMQSGILPEEIVENYINHVSIFQTWKLTNIPLGSTKEYEKLIHLKHYLKGLYQSHRRDPIGVDIGIIKEKISAIPHNMENYLSLDIGNQRYMDSLQLIPGSLDSHVSNLGAEPCKEEVDKNGKSLNLSCKKPGHLYRIDSNRCFAHPERFPITREHGPKGRDNLVFRKGIFPYDWFNASEKMNATSLSPIEAFDKTPDLFNKITKYEIPDDIPKGYILEVDLDYPYKLHKSHSAYPLAPKNIEISKKKMSEYGQEIINDLKHYSKTKKLVPNLNNKKKYIVHYRTLQFYIKQGMVLTKIHQGIEFNQSSWMKPFMEELARSRALAKNDFEKNMYKLLGNTNYGKTVENVRKYQRVDFVRPKGESKKFKRLVADPSYKSYRILVENLIALGKEKIALNKKVPGKFKDENHGTAMWKFCGPRSKLYSYILADGKTDRRAKGIQKIYKKLNKLEEKFRLLEEEIDDLIDKALEIKWEIRDITKALSLININVE